MQAEEANRSPSNSRRRPVFPAVELPSDVLELSEQGHGLHARQPGRLPRAKGRRATGAAALAPREEAGENDEGVVDGGEVSQVALLGPHRELDVREEGGGAPRLIKGN